MEPKDFVKLVNKVVKPIRKAMKSINNRRSGSLVQIFQQKSFPAELINWVSMLIEESNASNYKSQNI